MQRSVSFTLAAPTKTLNELRRMHFRAYAKHRAALAFEVFARTMKQRPAIPFSRALILVERYGERDVDFDGLIGGLKPLLDVLQPFHAKVRPNGLGIIASDAPGCLTLEMSQKLAPRCSGKTIVTISEISA
jgi:hypothetical protein